MSMSMRSFVLAAAAAIVFHVAPPAAADQLCIKVTGSTRLIRIRAAGCRLSEVSIGSFDGATLQLRGINLQVVSGAGATDAPVNGRGNLIVGYNEASGQARTGSHNVIVGPGHEYTSYGGVVAGAHNRIVGEYASVTGGRESVASGSHAAIAGGLRNEASGDYAVVAGGGDNLASGTGATVSGGQQHVASGTVSSIAGGFANAANEFASTATGGACNDAGGGGAAPCSPAPCTVGCYSTVAGGVRNQASGLYSTVGGGVLRSATGDHDWVAGSLFEDF
jgi:hypothetical protein